MSWKFMTAKAPHFGVLWESGVKSNDPNEPSLLTPRRFLIGDTLTAVLGPNSLPVPYNRFQLIQKKK